jgi:hypothetical protein
MTIFNRTSQRIDFFASDDGPHQTIAIETSSAGDTSLHNMLGGNSGNDTSDSLCSIGSFRIVVLNSLIFESYSLRPDIAPH